MLPVGPPIENKSLNGILGKRNTGANVLQIALIMPTNVTSARRSDETIFPTCFLPVSTITLGLCKTIVILVSSEFKIRPGPTFCLLITSM